MRWFRRRIAANRADANADDSGKTPHLPARSTDPAVQLDEIQTHIRGQVPAAVEARVARISATIRVTLPRLDQLGIGSATAYAVVQTATNYLPEALGGYLRLPRAFADKRPVSNGKTSLMVLCDQLDLLGNKMDEVLDAVCRADADALVAHGRFLDEKFGKGSLHVAEPMNLEPPK